ncbi:glutamate mutase L [Luedemannella helvata]|uniref:Methylaspartate mutase accessory protein GlmL n=1 Tax=Luedemannella helvata TaxID=349315 RepID=A0ABN2K9M9_9ACTN
MSVAVCADVGSTYTKVAVVDLDSGALVATAARPTTITTDVLHGLDAAVSAAGAPRDAATYVCSSAGGGLRLAVVGYERRITAEAARRVALTAGARVVHIAHGRLDPAGVQELRQARPDVILLAGGTDGGDEDVLRHNADRLARARVRVPVVLAGNAEARDAVAAHLGEHRVPVVATDNVLPRIGELNPAPARAAIREVFLRHVIGGKGLSRGTRFASLVRGATPDVVLTAVALLADELGGDLLAVDVGGATTDVYSVLRPDDAGADVAGTLWHGRTVEGDLGVRWSAPGVLDAAATERLAVDPDLVTAAPRRAADPALLADGDADLRLARLAATVAVRRHGRDRDLRRVRLVVGSGGVLRHAAPAAARSVLDAILADHAGGWRVPTSARVLIDHEYVLAAAGLLAQPHPAAARRLLRARLAGD